MEDVGFVYGEGTVFRTGALNGVSIEIKKGRVTGIIGHTGSGKSTLVQMMNGLIEPSQGRVLLYDEDIFANKKNLRRVRFRVGLVFQYPEYQLFEETVYKDIAYGPTNMGLSSDEIKRRVEGAGEFVGLDRELFAKSPFELSGGQKRRVAIAGIMAMEPEVLVLDEPASGLDPVGRKEIFSGLVRYKQATGSTVVIVSHSMEDMAEYADDIIVMNQGKCFFQGQKEQAFAKADELCAIGLDIPQITSLANKLRERGARLPEGLYTVEDTARELLRLIGSGGGL